MIGLDLSTSAKLAVYLDNKKQRPEVFRKKRCSWRFPKIHKKDSGNGDFLRILRNL